MFTKIQETQKEFMQLSEDMFNKSISYNPDLKGNFEKVKAVLEKETSNSKEVWTTYSKFAKGDASPNELTRANAALQEMFKAANFAWLLIIPGVIFSLPILEIGRAHV